MPHLSEEEKSDIQKAIQDRGAVLPCPRCANKSFILIDGYFNQTIQGKITGIVLGGQTIPSVVVACDNCGYMSQHAIGVLGLLPKNEEPKK